MKKTVLHLLVVTLVISLFPKLFWQTLYAKETKKPELTCVKTYDDYVKLLKERKVLYDKDAFKYLERYRSLDVNTQDIAPTEEFDSAPSSSSANSSYSTTNLQVSGVDENDTMKNDDRYIYKITDAHTIAIIDTKPTLKTAGKIYNAKASFSSMFLKGNELIVIAAQNANFNVSEPMLKDQSHAYTTLYKKYTSVFIYNISNKSAPALKREVKLEGTGEAFRMIDQTLYMLTSSYIPAFPLDSYSKDVIIPTFSDSLLKNDLQSIDLSRCFASNWRPDTSSAYRSSQRYTLMAAIDLSNKEAVSPTCLLIDSSMFYMNKNALFIADCTYDSMPCTYISRFNVTGSTLSYAATGRINGTLYSQFAMDETNGYFRTASNVFESERSSEITVFDANMDQVACLGGLAPNESIYSARFEKNRCYLVTYRNTDPLFVIDLTNPKQPSVLGELKIPGVSYYLHPIAENLVVGIGLASEAETAGLDTLDDTSRLSGGIKLSLYDVSNASAPKEINKLIVGDCNSYTPALSDHKAVTVHRGKNLLAIPVFLRFDASRGLDNFQGAYVFGLKKGKLEGKAKLGYVDTEKSDVPYYYSSRSDKDRVCFIGDKLYFLYQNKINAYELSNYHRIQTLTLPSSQS